MAIPAWGDDLVRCDDCRVSACLGGPACASQRSTGKVADWKVDQPQFGHIGYRGFHLCSGRLAAFPGTPFDGYSFLGLSRHSVTICGFFMEFTVSFYAGRQPALPCGLQKDRYFGLFGWAVCSRQRDPNSSVRGCPDYSRSPFH